MRKVAPRERCRPSSRRGQRTRHTPRRARRAALAVLATTVAGAAGLGVAASAAFAAEQPWGFEQVTPPVKGGGNVMGFDTFRAGPDGDSLLYSATSPFAGVPAESSPMYTRYIGRRGADGWRNRALDPPFEGADGADSGIASMLVVSSSYDLAHVMVSTPRALTPGATEGGSNVYIRDTRTGAYTLVATSSSFRLTNVLATNGGALSAKYVAPDGRSALFVTTLSLVPGAPDNGLTGAGVLYSWTASDGLRAESVLPASEGGDIVGAGSLGWNAEGGTRSAMPFTGGLDHTYFTTIPAGNSGPAYVRTGDATRLISHSRIPGDASAPAAASLDAVADGGRYALFHTLSGAQRPLTADTPTDVPAGDVSFLYRYDVANDSLAYVGTLDGSGGGSNSLAVLQMTQDGQTVAFQSRLALAGDAVEGELNMYVWRRGTLRFVATADPDSTTTSGPKFLRVLSPDGRYLSFTDSSSSVAQRFGFDNVSLDCPLMFGGAGPCSQVYLYDADADQLSCVSCRTDGEAPRGDAGDSMSLRGYVRMDSYQMQTVANDGTVFFSSPDDLLPEDGNGNYDVYSSSGGQLRLVSRGTQGTSARFIDATPDGKTIFFATNDTIVGTDDDKAVDVYMTRQGAGFPYTAPVVTPPCSASDCRGPLAPPADLPAIGSGASGRGNPPLPAAPPAKATIRVSGSAGRVSVRVPGAGRITASGASIRTAKRAATKAGTYSLAVSLNAKAKKALAKRRSLKVRVRVAFTPRRGAATSKTLSLTFKAPQAKPTRSTTKGGR